MARAGRGASVALALVLSLTTAACAENPKRQLPIRHRIRAFLGVVLVLLGVLAPAGSPDLPAPLDDLVGAPLASAQTPPPPTVIDGTPDPCLATPVLWSPQPLDSDFMTASECVLELPACPESPLVSGHYMRLSVPPAGLATQFPDLALLYPNAIEYPRIAGMDRYPEFCEERVLQIDDPIIYNACINLTGYTVIQYTDGGQPGCRLIHPISCAAGLHRDSSTTCRAVHRRNWTCATGYIPRNEFNTCYQAPTLGVGTHPACGRGAPEFLVMDCEEYVGDDFIHNASTIDCAADYSTGTPAQHTDGTQAVFGARLVELEPNYNSGLTSSDFWCAFETRFLIADCHRTDISPVECSSTAKALCLKRASATGGCNLTAATIRCRALEAAFAQQPTVTTIEEVRQQGCAPCLILPFRRIPSQCQLRPPRRSLTSYVTQQRVISVMDDFATDVSACRSVNTPADLAGNARCRGYLVCADPPRGRIDWTSNHFSQLAVVNSPILVQFLDIPLQNATLPYMYYSDRRGRDPIYRTTDYSPQYADPIGGDPRFRMFSRINQSNQYSSVDRMILRECRVGSDPYFELIIEELWPDTAQHRLLIQQLFGTNALNWWNSLSPSEQERRTLARGLQLLSSPPTATELEARSAELTTQFHCNLSDGRACRWLPGRPGFYRLRGVGAWQVSVVGSRQWGDQYDANHLDVLINHLNMASAEDGVCQPAYSHWYNADPNWERMRDKDCIRDDIVRAGFATPSEMGLLDDLSGVLPRPPTAAALFNEDHAGTAGCFPRDLRVECVNSYGTGNYTETEPIGIIVHEVRVSTVTPLA